MNKIVIATSTLYHSPKEVRFELATKTMKEAKNYGYTIIVIDESPKELGKLFIPYGAKVFNPEKPGMGNCRRQAITEAGRIINPEDIIVWIEPEKYPFIPFLGKIAEELSKQNADMIVPRRKSLDLYPQLQQRFEWLNNHIFYLFTGLNLDYCSGVRAFRKHSSNFFLEYNGEYGDLWEIALVPILRMIASGKKIAEIEVAYEHPKKQTASEENDQINMFKKRLKQLINTLETAEKECDLLKHLK